MTRGETVRTAQSPKPDATEATLRRAFEHHQQGHRPEAEALYLTVLQRQPRHHDALHLLGVLKLQCGCTAEGASLIERSLRIDPRQAGAHLNLGNALLDLDRPAEALASFDRALQLQRDFPEALYNRANALSLIGRPEEAAESYAQALLRRPAFAEALLALGNVHMRLRRPAAAKASYERLLELDPQHVPARLNLGNALQELNQPQLALAAYERVLTDHPDCVEAHNNRGTLLRKLGRHGEALAEFELAVLRWPNLAASWSNRALALAALGRPAEALTSIERALAIEPAFTEALNNRGNILRELGQLRSAIESYDRAIAVSPEVADAHVNRGIAWLELRRPQEALVSLERALQLPGPGFEAWNTHGNALAALQRPEDALHSYARALTLEPDKPEVLRNQGLALQRLRRLQEAAQCFRSIERIAPGYEWVRGMALECDKQLCRWAVHDAETLALAQRLRAGSRVVPPFPFLSMSSSAGMQRLCAQTRARQEAGNCPSTADRSGYGHERVRVAYVSADLREHVVSYLMAGVFEQHDRERFEVIAVSIRPEEDTAMGRRVKGAFERFIDVSGRSDLEVAQLLRELEVDIAVDLMGFTEDARPAIFAHRAAPVQVNYLGFPGTMGADFMDYIIADEFVIPRSSREHYAEQVVYLPECFQANDDRRPIGAVPSREEAGLPARAVVLCCFNNSYKLNPQMFELWCRVLCAVPGSVLWLVVEGQEARENLWCEGERRGVGRERLIMAERLPYAQHLGRLGLADLFLDTLPFNAGATASDALWAGVPILTCTGEAFAARMAGSLLRTVGLAELICEDLQHYEQLALELSRAPERLLALKAHLQQQRQSAALFNTARFCRHLEAAYLQMWQRAERGERPGLMSIPPEPR